MPGTRKEAGTPQGGGEQNSHPGGITKTGAARIHADDLAVGFLYPLLVLFAADAECGFETRFKTFGRDGLPTLLAQTEGSVLNALKRVINLLQKDLLASPQPEGRLRARRLTNDLRPLGNICSLTDVKDLAIISHLPGERAPTEWR